eukprot:CAMPEP_0174936270 /NCGR_PEP_ID=MMETSP1355-20121228/56864_1 /TAXON_ID=464990 /ORGANISM="Hemiselmis tepida, Strain CCMP443" /LENGTH=71 /DNA_ID=CAMNT_0016183039 /DNA_START=108 /DNA_END=323 /DNA_ORIENTATION=-
MPQHVESVDLHLLFQRANEGTELLHGIPERGVALGGEGVLGARSEGFTKALPQAVVLDDPPVARHDCLERR